VVARGEATPGQGANRSATARADAPARPPVSNEPAILGLSRLSRSRVGSRLFRWFFVFVFAVIFLQLVVSLLNP
jgi:hypothetical protein